jgi:hypothetical protein
MYSMIALGEVTGNVERTCMILVSKTTSHGQGELYPSYLAWQVNQVSVWHCGDAALQ